MFTRFHFVHMSDNLRLNQLLQYTMAAVSFTATPEQRITALESDIEQANVNGIRNIMRAKFYEDLIGVKDAELNRVIIKYDVRVERKNSCYAFMYIFFRKPAQELILQFETEYAARTA